MTRNLIHSVNTKKLLCKHEHYWNAAQIRHFLSCNILPNVQENLGAQAGLHFCSAVNESVSYINESVLHVFN